MFGNFKERFQSVRHDVTQGWKSIADKAKSVNKKIVRKTTFITDEIIEGEDQCFSCDLEAGSEILSKYQKDWVDIHEASRSSTQEAEKADQVINIALKRFTELRNTMTIFQGELEKLPEVIKNVETATGDVEAIGSQSEVLEGLLLDLEEVCEKVDVERRKTNKRLQIIMLQQSKLDDLETMKEDLELEHEIKTQTKERLERQESIEKQKVYEDAFIEQMNYYIQFGKTEEPISAILESGRSLADIKLEGDTVLDKQLDDFLGPDSGEPEDPSIPPKAPDNVKRKKASSSPTAQQSGTKSTDSQVTDETTASSQQSTDKPSTSTTTEEKEIVP